MHRDQSPLRARTAPEVVLSLHLDLDQMPDEFTRQPVTVEFRFDPDLPAVITVEFMSERESGLVRRIGRELLHRGLTAMSGSGDERLVRGARRAVGGVARRHVSDHPGRGRDRRPGLGRPPQGAARRPGNGPRMRGVLVA
ncbi:SsgA family sporulation/cell division regulator [Streptomyces sp. NPDC001833]|uniref:SsgA family sporulation/cell division regulator n=1 Tax=Streptomyces sp. NPDC001833 TaxID=3154658 RepID=UPI00331BC06B